MRQPKKDTFWDLRIRAAEARGSFTEDDRRRATDWVTCACGQQDPRIPRYESGGPVDEQLDTFGLDFAMAVRADNMAGARSLLAKIESRARAVLMGVLREKA